MISAKAHRNAKTYEHLQSVPTSYQCFQEAIDPRRLKEMRDGAMVPDDHTVMANLSHDGFQREIPQRGHWFMPLVTE